MLADMLLVIVPGSKAKDYDRRAEVSEAELKGDQRRARQGCFVTAAVG